MIYLIAAVAIAVLFLIKDVELGSGSSEKKLGAGDVTMDCGCVAKYRVDSRGRSTHSRTIRCGACAKVESDFRKITRQFKH